MYTHGAGEFLDDLVRAVKFPHVVAINHVHRAVLATSDQFVSEGAGEGGDDDARAGAQIQVIVVEEEVRGKIIQYFERVTARREFEISVAPVSNAGVERAVTGYGKDLVGEGGLQGTAPDRDEAASSAAVGGLVARRIEYRNL